MTVNNKGIYPADQKLEEITIKINDLKIENNTPECVLYINKVRVGIIYINTDDASRPGSFAEGTMKLKCFNPETEEYYRAHPDKYASDMSLIDKRIREGYGKLTMLSEARGLELFESEKDRTFLCSTFNKLDREYYLISGRLVINNESNTRRTYNDTHENRPETDNQRTEDEHPTGDNFEDGLIRHDTLGGCVFEKTDINGNGTGEYIDGYGQPTNYGDQDDWWWL